MAEGAVADAVHGDEDAGDGPVLPLKVHLVALLEDEGSGVGHAVIGEGPD